MNITRYWIDHYVSPYGHCTLCGNKGRIDTSKTAKTPTGALVGRINFCICPNGRALRKHEGVTK